MSCISDTNSVDLTIAGGTLSADVKISAPAATAAPNPLSVASDGLLVAGSDGWLALPATLAYSSTSGAGGAACYVCTTSADLTAFLAVGAKVRLVHSGATKYFLVVAVAGGGSPTVTLWGGDLYSLSAGAITVPYFGLAEMPVGWHPEISRCTAPPATAYDGMLIRYIADSTNGVEWTMEYVAAEATYKWRFAGGGRVYQFVAASTTVASASYADWGGSSFTLPRAGDWHFLLNCSGYNDTNTNGPSPTAALNINGSDVDTATGVAGTTQSPYSMVIEYIGTGLAAGITVKLRKIENGYTGSQTGTMASADFSYQPRRFI